MNVLTTILALSITLSFTVSAHGDKHEKNGVSIGLDTSAAKVVQTFHAALNTGNTELARAQLAADVTIYEGGQVERSADEYANHHMLADMKFLAAVTTKTLEHEVKVLGNTAISASRSHTTGTYKNKKIDHQGMETMVLEKQNDVWKIKHIHWSN